MTTDRKPDGLDMIDPDDVVLEEGTNLVYVGPDGPEDRPHRFRIDDGPHKGKHIDLSEAEGFELIFGIDIDAPLIH